MSGHDKISKLCVSRSGPTKNINSLSAESFETAAGDSKVPIDDIAESTDTHQLKTKIAELEERCNNLFFENEQAHIDLAHEKHKVVQLERQLQLAKDNQEVFQKIRQAYINIRQDEPPGRKLVEVRDKEVQTWQGILCRACLDTERLRVELEQVRAAFEGCLIIKQGEMDKISDTLQVLKSYTNYEEYNSSSEGLIKTEENKTVDIVKNHYLNVVMKNKKRLEEKRINNNISLFGDKWRSRSVDRDAHEKFKRPLNKEWSKSRNTQSSVELGAKT